MERSKDDKLKIDHTVRMMHGDDAADQLSEKQEGPRMFMAKICRSRLVNKKQKNDLRGCGLKKWICAIKTGNRTDNVVPY